MCVVSTETCLVLKYRLAPWGKILTGSYPWCALRSNDFAGGHGLIDGTQSKPVLFLWIVGQAEHPISICFGRGTPIQAFPLLKQMTLTQREFIFGTCTFNQRYLLQSFITNLVAFRL